MLTTATMVMSFGTDSANVRLASTDRANSADISFAKSFDESSALAVEAPPPAAGDKKLKDAVDLEKSAPVNDRGAIAAGVGTKIKQDVNAGDEVQNESAGAKNLPALSSEKATPPMTVGVTIPSTGILQHGGKAKNSSPAIETEIPESSLSSQSEDVKNVPQKNAPPVDDTKPNATEATVGFQADGVASVVAAISDCGIKPLIQDPKAKPILDKNQGAVATEKGTKSHDGVVKTVKSAKAEEKKTAETVENTAGAEVQTLIATQMTVPPLGGTQQALNVVAEESARSSVGSPTSGRGTGAVIASPGARDKDTEAIKKGDDDNVKTSGSVVVDDSASQKTEAKESKTALSTIKPAADDNAATRSTAEPLTVSGPAHAELRATVANIGAVAGGTAAHIAATGNVQATVINPHAATVLANSTAIDSGAVVDATHKTLMATPTSLEIGIVNGTHGWLKIRADMTDGGVVNASLSTTTSSGQEMLHRELPSLTAYLQNERVAVNTVVVQPSMTPGAELRGFEGGMAGDGRGPAPQSGSQGGESRQGAADSGPVQIEREGFYSGMSGVGRDELLPLASRTGGGNWLNVRA
jgi:hypothetical protein